MHFHIIIGIYGTAYLEYIFGPGSQPVLPTHSEISFLELQESGPFDITSQDELRKFLLIMLSFLLWQLARTSAGTTFKTALG